MHANTIGDDNADLMIRFDDINARIQAGEPVGTGEWELWRKVAGEPSVDEQESMYNEFLGIPALREPSVDERARYEASGKDVLAQARADHESGKTPAVSLAAQMKALAPDAFNSIRHLLSPETMAAVEATAYMIDAQETRIGILPATAEYLP